MAALTTFSKISGYASIACWLGAQFPQVMKNVQMQSSDGLALPFLANWLAGDVSNLIGCILTHQLPFQTWLAIYFCFVDMTLLGQYIYYRSRKPIVPIYGHARIRTTSITGRRVSSERHIPHYRSLSTVAANVAAGAALAAQQEGHDVQYPRWQSSSADRLGEASGSHISREPTEHEDDDDAALADSFHSEGGWSSKQKGVSWSSERFGRSGSVGRGRMGHTSPLRSSLHITPSQHRGRALQREGDPSTEEEPEEWNRSRTISAHRASSRASRRGAGMVFLGVWALFGIGTLAGTDRHSLSPATVANVGKVLTGDSISITHIATTASAAAAYSAPLAESSPLPVVLGDDNNLPADQPSEERAVGRIFAWLCTTLYLTSRLPQIWKNYVRKSVEGLSIYLFIFAFLGNSFYVASILTAPGMRLDKEAFIRESIPYLLGSGGTLLFDITIVNQSLIYRRRPSRRVRRYSVRSRTLEEEGAALLGADTLA